MLQRIQSIYLLVSLVIGISLAFFPLAEFNANDSIYFVKAFGIFYQDTDSLLFESPFQALSIVWIFHLLITASSIFQFKNRKTQIKICSLNIVLLFVIAGLLFFVEYSIPDDIKEESEPAVNYLFGSLLPFVSIVFQILAMRAIQKDEKLIKSIDRIR